MNIKSFDDIEEVFSAIARETEEANSRSTDWQKQVVPGMYFLRVISGIELCIYGQVLDPADVSDVSDPEIIEEILEGAEIYNEPHMAGYRFTKCYSQICSYGELGDTHVSTMAMLLSKEQFNLAESLNWPSDSTGLGKILALKSN